MDVSNVVLDQSSSASSWKSSIRKGVQDFDQLAQSLQNGNVNGAQQAYSDFQNILTGLTSAAQNGATTAGSTAQSDWNALGQALQSGSLSSAQGALGKLTQDVQSAWQAQLQNAYSAQSLLQGTQTTSSSQGAAASTPSGTSVIQTDISALSQALQSGDSNGAQKLLAQLQQDLQAAGQSTGSTNGAQHHHHHHHHSPFSGMSGSETYASSAATSGSSTQTSATTSTATTG